MQVSELLTRISGFPPDAPVLLEVGERDRAVHDAELIQGGWEPPFVRITPLQEASEEAGSGWRMPAGWVLLLLVAALGFILGYFTGRG